MKKLSVVMLAMFFCVGVSFAARGGTATNNYSSSKKVSSSGSCSHGNFAIGYSKASIDLGRNGANFMNTSVDEIAARFWINDTIGIDAQLGFSTGDANSTFLVGAKVIGNFIQVNKLNIYWLAGVTFGSYDPKIPGGNSFSVFRIQGGVGAELFVLPCLSVLTEMGIRYDSASANGTSVSQMGIFADWLPQAGVRFYF